MSSYQGSNYQSPGQFQAPSAAPGGVQSFGTPTSTSRRPPYIKTGVDGEAYIDYTSVDDLRRLMTPNGKIYSRKRLGVTAREQRMVAQAIKRARYMSLLPFTNATM